MSTLLFAVVAPINIMFFRAGQGCGLMELCSGALLFATCLGIRHMEDPHQTEIVAIDKAYM